MNSILSDVGRCLAFDRRGFCLWQRWLSHSTIREKGNYLFYWPIGMATNRSDGYRIRRRILFLSTFSLPISINRNTFTSLTHTVAARGDNNKKSKLIARNAKSKVNRVNESCLCEMCKVDSMMLCL